MKATPEELRALAKETVGAFLCLKVRCPYLNEQDDDCQHPENDFSHMSCDHTICPLLDIY